MSFSLDNLSRVGLVASWGDGVGEIQAVVQLTGYFCAATTGYLTPGTGPYWLLAFPDTTFLPAPGAVPDQAYQLNEFRYANEWTILEMGGKPIHMRGGTILISQSGSEYVPVVGPFSVGPICIVYAPFQV